jgi:hypothetical protein
MVLLAGACGSNGGGGVTPGGDGAAGAGTGGGGAGGTGPMRGGTPPMGMGGDGGAGGTGGGTTDARAGDAPLVDGPRPPDGTNPPPDGPADRPPPDMPPPAPDLPPPLPDRPPVTGNSCNADGECVMSTYDRPVLTVRDCYCPLCPSTALNRATADAYTEQWKSHCTDWHRTANCPQVRCVPPESPRCLNSMCRAPSTTPPAMCPGGVGCPGGGPRCGLGCCKLGEWCDLGMCRCGATAGCAGSDECSSFGPVGGSRCGSRCCGLTSGRPCPQ